MKQLRTRGVTLIELMTAMAIFAMLGAFLFTLVRDSLGIYRKSRASGEIYDKFDQATEVLMDDLSCVVTGDPEGNGVKVDFLLSHDRRYVPPENVTLSREAQAAADYAAGDSRSFLLRFVRTFPGGELEDTVGRFAGTYVGGSRPVDGVNDLAESRHERILKEQLVPRAGQDRMEGDEQTPGLEPPGGLMEVMYFCARTPEDAEGTFTLYRAFRSPVGGAQSFMTDAHLKRMTPDWISQHARPVVSGLIYFGAVLWGQNTREWATERVLSGEAAGRGLAELWWDSRRARYPAFSLHRGDDSLNFFDDDVFPSRLQFVMSIVQDGRASIDATLTGGVSATTRTILLNDGALFDGSRENPPTHLLIDQEWMEVKSARGRRLTVVRGARQTRAVKHDSGRPVRVGRTFRLTLDVPAHRSSYVPLPGGPKR